jgi:hypothetical protein
MHCCGRALMEKDNLDITAVQRSDRTLSDMTDAYIVSPSCDEKTPPPTAFLDVFCRPKYAYTTQDPASV